MKKILIFMFILLCCMYQNIFAENLYSIDTDIFAYINGKYIDSYKLLEIHIYL